MTNPIPFNPDLMTVCQLKACAETLRSMFNYLDSRDPEPDYVVHCLKNRRESWVRDWGAQ